MNLFLIHFSFSVELKDFKFFYNDERTRSFVSVMASRGMNQMLKLVKCVDSSFKKFKQPKYYKVLFSNFCDLFLSGLVLEPGATRVARLGCW